MQLSSENDATHTAYLTKINMDNDEEGNNYF